MRDEQVAKLSYIQSLDEGSMICSICNDHINSAKQGAIIICPDADCNRLSHISCLGQMFLQQDLETLLPSRGTCSSCGKDHTWGQLVKGAHFRHLLQTKGDIEVDEDEFAELENDGQSDTESSVLSTSSDEETLMSSTLQHGISVVPAEARGPIPLERRGRSVKIQDQGMSTSQSEKVKQEILVID